MILYDIKVKPKIRNDQAMNPKKLGIFTPFSSAMARTIKLGAFPIYVNAPINTAPLEIASKVELNLFIKISGFPPATSKNTRYVGALSKKADNKPVTQKYIISLWHKSLIHCKAPPSCDKILRTGIIVINIPINSLATSVMGNQVNPF